MTTKQTGTILRYLRSLVDAETTRNLSDAQLLQQFAARREEAAFAALVQRHGLLVWGVCQHLLHHEQDAEDAFQATFLVLARRAGSIRKTEAVGSFLHGVAYRIALRAKQNARKRQAHERQAVRPSPEQPPDDLAWRELQAMLDEEVARLPAKFRSPFILCCLEGKSREEAARELRCKEGTVSSRIARARLLLQRRLGQRGATLSAALCAAVLWKQTAAATVPALLATNTVQAAAGSVGGFSAAVTILADGALHAMGFARWHIGNLLILGIGLLAAGAGVGRYFAVALPEAAPQEVPAAPAEARKDRYGDPLPPGALARLGTVRQRAPDSHLAVTADGKEIVAVGDDLTVRRFDAQTGELRSINQLPKTSGTGLFRTWLSPRGTFVLTACNIGPRYHLELWDLAAGKIRQKLPLSEDNVGLVGAAFSADERHVAVAEISLDRKTLQVLIWDLETSKSRLVWLEKKDKSVPMPYSPIVVLSPDGKRLAVHHIDQILRCWDAESGKLLWQAEEKKHCPLIVFSADSRLIYTRLEVEKTPGYITRLGIEIRDAATGKLLPRTKPPKGAGIPIGSSPDGRFLAFLTMKEEVVLWEPGKDKITFRFPPPPHRRDDPFPIGYTPNQLLTNFAFTPDGKGFIRRAGSLQRWDLSTGKPVFTDTENWGHAEDVTRLLFSPDGRWLASSSKDQTIRLWNVATARTVHSFSKEDSDHLAFTPDGRSLLTVPHYFRLRNSLLLARDVVSGRPGRSYELGDDPSVRILGVSGKELRYTADGKRIQLLNWRSDSIFFMVWNAATGKCLVNKKVPLGEWVAPENLLTPDGQSVLVFDDPSQTVRLLSLETSQPRWQLKMGPEHDMGHYHGCKLALSPDGRMMAARTYSPNVFVARNKRESIVLADMATGRQLAKISMDGPAIFDFSADNRLLAVAGTTGIRLWETTTRKEIGFIQIPNRDVRPQDRACASSLAFSPDGRVLATGHADGTILLWDATLRRGRHGGQLTAAQYKSLWTDLAGTDAVKAYAAIGQLADDPASSVAFLKEWLKPVPPVPADVLRSLLEDLDSDQFAVREAAQKKLRALGERAASPLRAELKAKPSLEKRKRIEELLARLDATGPLSGEVLRSLRAVQVLERIGSAEARQFLEHLSRGVESARLTQAANEALTRLKKR
ncbi:MAG TPA: sigma-70 family RNA polymerase sigma factor [Gemmataceae bacterium]|nr:sigma-70 family RNA polymerase sigma factor [Gemmataceae bacterium]